KFVGASEANMLSNLARLDHEEPCVALFDEVEKVFATNNHDSSGTTSTMLSQLLWWLAERRSRVLVVMTTNNAKALPKELYRDGRIDETMWFGGLDKTDALSFISNVLGTFNIEMAKGQAAILQTVQPIPGSKEMFSQAALTQAVYAYVKTLKKSA